MTFSAPWRLPSPKANPHDDHPASSDSGRPDYRGIRAVVVVPMTTLLHTLPAVPFLALIIFAVITQ
jgi:hypothetical protein